MMCLELDSKTVSVKRYEPRTYYYNLVYQYIKIDQITHT